VTSEATQPSVESGCQAFVPTSYVFDMADYDSSVCGDGTEALHLRLAL
jgi:hypothetical protein